jgi:hypothetical protein
MKLITKRMRSDFKAAFGSLESKTKSERNKTWLDENQVKLIKDTRAQGITPKQLEELTGISVYKIHKIVNSNQSGPNMQSNTQVTNNAPVIASNVSTSPPMPKYIPKQQVVKPTNYIARNLEDPLTIIIAHARGHAVLFDQIQKKKQKLLRKQVPAGRSINYYCEKYNSMKTKIDTEYNSQGKFPPEDYMLRHLMLAKLISDMECPTKIKRNKEKYKPKTLARAEECIRVQQELIERNNTVSNDATSDAYSNTVNAVNANV